MINVDYVLSYLLSLIILHFIYLYYYLTFMLNSYKYVQEQNSINYTTNYNYSTNIFIDTIHFETNSVYGVPFNNTM